MKIPGPHPRSTEENPGVGPCILFLGALECNSDTCYSKKKTTVRLSMIRESQRLLKFTYETYPMLSFFLGGGEIYIIMIKVT